jgi:hypothetical protein
VDVEVGKSNNLGYGQHSPGRSASTWQYFLSALWQGLPSQVRRTTFLVVVEPMTSHWFIRCPSGFQMRTDTGTPTLNGGVRIYWTGGQDEYVQGCGAKCRTQHHYHDLQYDLNVRVIHF